MATPEGPPLNPSVDTAPKPSEPAKTALLGAMFLMATSAVGPGFILTPLIQDTMDEAALQGLAARHAPGRLGTSEEVSALTLFLLSDRASFITGSYHLVDGGYTAP